MQHSILISLKIQGLEGIAGVSNYIHKLVICPENEEWISIKQSEASIQSQREAGRVEDKEMQFSLTFLGLENY